MKNESTNDELNKHYSTILIHLHNNGETTAIAEINKKKIAVWSIMYKLLNED